MGASELKLFLEGNVHTHACTYTRTSRKVLSLAKDQIRVWYKVWMILFSYMSVTVNRMKPLSGPKKSLNSEPVHSQMHGSSPAIRGEHPPLASKPLTH